MIVLASLEKYFYKEKIIIPDPSQRLSYLRFEKVGGVDAVEGM